MKIKTGTGIAGTAVFTFGTVAYFSASNPDLGALTSASAISCFGIFMGGRAMKRKSYSTHSKRGK